jgi:hypothetical protein
MLARNLGVCSRRADEGHELEFNVRLNEGLDFFYGGGPELVKGQETEAFGKFSRIELFAMACLLARNWGYRKGYNDALLLV